MNFTMIISVLGGLGLFLLGMTMMSDGLKKVAGDGLKTILDHLTNNPLKAIALGTIITMLIQSSSATTVMVVGLINAGLITINQGAGVILGANIGTTITAQLIAFNISEYAPLFIIIGVILKLFGQKDKLIDIGETILGFGLLFMGIGLMSSTLKPLADSPEFANILVSLGKNPMLGLLAGAVVTAIIQSSSASIGLLQALALGGAFSAVSGNDMLSIVIPILLGMNIGTCITAIFSMVGASNSAKQAAFLHLFVNIILSTWVMLLLYFTGGLTGDKSSFIYDLIMKISDNASRQIANSHMILNIANTLVILPFLTPVVNLIKRLIPEDTEEEEEFKVRLDDRLLENQAVAIGETVDEVIRMGEYTYRNLETAYEACLNSDEKLIEKVFEREAKINMFETDITEFLVNISSLSLSFKEADLTMHLYTAIHDFERIGDHATNIASMTKTKMKKGIKFSKNAKEELTMMFDEVLKSVRLSLDAFKEKDIEKALSISEIEDQINDYEKQLRKAHIKRLNKASCTPDSGVLYLDMVTDLERIGDYSKSIANFVTENINLL